MGKFIQEYGAINTTNGNALAALGSTMYTLVNDFPFDENCTLKDWHVMGRITRSNPGMGIYLLLVVPDAMVAAVKAADWGLAATWKMYENLVWMSHRFYFGSSAQYGQANRDFEFKPSTMRILPRDYTLLTLLYIEDLAGQATVFDLSCTVQYKIKSNESV